MSCSKPLPSFTFDVLCYFNRDQLERFSIVCRSLKNFVERYFRSKPYRVFAELCIRGEMYALVHREGITIPPIFTVQWHPNRNDYSVQQFLAGQKCNIDESKRYLDDPTYYPFAEMRPYLGPAVLVKSIFIYVARESIYNPEHIEEMELIAHLWRDGNINIWNIGNRIVAEDFQPILNSPTILQCQLLFMSDAHFSFKDYKVLYAVKVFEIEYHREKMDPNYWPQFLEEPGVKPVVILHNMRRESVANMVDRLSKAFSSAVSPNAFKIVFAKRSRPLTEFRETNKTSGEKLELIGYQDQYLKKYRNYTLERSGI